VKEKTPAFAGGNSHPMFPSRQEPGKKLLDRKILFQSFQGLNLIQGIFY
jgi:hypothetical protein